MSKSTRVSKTHPTIKKILAASASAPSVTRPFKGTKVTVEENRNLSYEIYLEMGSPTVAFVVAASGATGQEVRRPSMSEPTVRLTSALYDEYGGACVVVYHRGSSGSVTIFIPELDPAALSVATDALLRDRNRKLAAETLKQCGVYAGIAMAVAEAHVKALDKATSSSTGPADERTRRQVKRDIDDILGRRL